MLNNFLTYQRGYSRPIFGQRVSLALVQNMICLHRFVLGRSMFVPTDRVFSHASPCGPFQHIAFRRKAYQTNGKVEQCNQFCQGIEDRGFRGFIKTIIWRNGARSYRLCKLYVRVMMIYDKWCMNENCPNKVGAIWNPIKSPSDHRVDLDSPWHVCGAYFLLAKLP